MLGSGFWNENSIDERNCKLMHNGMIRLDLQTRLHSKRRAGFVFWGLNRQFYTCPKLFSCIIFGFVPCIGTPVDWSCKKSSKDFYIAKFEPFVLETTGCIFSIKVSMEKLILVKSFLNHKILCFIPHNVSLIGRKCQILNSPSFVFFLMFKLGCSQYCLFDFFHLALDRQFSFLNQFFDIKILHVTKSNANFYLLDCHNLQYFWCFQLSNSFIYKTMGKFFFDLGLSRQVS